MHSERTYVHVFKEFMDINKSSLALNLPIPVQLRYLFLLLYRFLSEKKEKLPYY